MKMEILNMIVIEDMEMLLLTKRVEFFQLTLIIIIVRIAIINNTYTYSSSNFKIRKEIQSKEKQNFHVSLNFHLLISSLNKNEKSKKFLKKVSHLFNIFFYLEANPF